MIRDNCVYKLIDPLDFVIRYIGITDNPKSRYSAHLHTYDPCNPQKVEWIGALRDHGLQPIMEIEASGLTREQALDREMALIHELLEQGVPLLNVDTRRPFSHWSQGEPNDPLVGYKVVRLPKGGYWIVGVIDYGKCLYRFLEDHQIYRADYHAYPKCQKLNRQIEAGRRRP